MMSKASTRHTIAPNVMQDAIEVYSWADECDRREEERGKPYPVITPCLLIAFALAVFAVNLAVFGKGAW